MAAMLELRGILATYDGRPVLDRLDLAVPQGQVVSVLGPSGGGKTTLLRIVAGLERPVAGQVLLDGRDLAGVPTHERGLGLMFQDYALFPHRDVAGNVGFGLRMAGWDAERIRARVAELLALVGLPGFEHRAVGRLSGGEQQRVALARALAPSPRVLMLDEPMGSLDRALRERLPDELAALFRTLGLTVLYVTHDHDEAMRIADRVVLLRDGRIEADEPPEVLWSAPPTRYAAAFLGYRMVIDGTLREGIVETAWGRFPVGATRPAAGASGPAVGATRTMDGASGPAAGGDSSAGASGPAAGGDSSAGASGPAAGGDSSAGAVGVLVRPDAVRLDPGGAIAGIVRSRRFRGDHLLLVVTLEGAPPLEVEARGEGVPATGDPVRVAIDPAGIVLLRDRP